MQIVLVGAGRLATNLGLALRQAGHHIMAVYSRTLESAEELTARIGGIAYNEVSALPLQADIFIVAVKDAVLHQVISQLTLHREDQLMVHTAGSMPMSLFQSGVSRYGVFYPMQSFSKERQTCFADIPIFLEASNDDTLCILRQLATSLTTHIYTLNSEDRKYLHLSAVFACNFVNHCYALSAQLLEEHGLPFSVMLPLIDETARKVHQLHPSKAQTGPAVRYDKNVISMQNQLLATHPAMQQVYQMLTDSIHQYALTEEKNSNNL